MRAADVGRFVLSLAAVLLGPAPSAVGAEPPKCPAGSTWPEKVRIEYDVFNDVYGLHVYFQVNDMDGTVIFERKGSGLGRVASIESVALMNDMLIGHNDPVDECLWIDHLIDDQYEVLIYAMTPDDPSRMCRVRVDNGSPGPTPVGGAWPGIHEAGVSYERFVVQTIAPS